jgi:predicted nucleic acid-binding Zn ribbon protein
MLPSLEKSDAETDRRKSGVYRHRDNRTVRQDTVSIGAAIEGAVAKLGLTAKFQEQRALSLWSEIVGEQAAEVTEAYRIQHGELLVSVNHATWRYHLMFERENFRQRINEAVGAEVVRFIRFTK